MRAKKTSLQIRGRKYRWQIHKIYDTFKISNLAAPSKPCLPVSAKLLPHLLLAVVVIVAVVKLLLLLHRLLQLLHTAFFQIILGYNVGNIFRDDGTNVWGGII